MSDVARLDPRLPVLVGVGQLNQRVDRGAPELEPTALDGRGAADRRRRCGRSRGLLEQADSVGVVHVLSWRYADPGRLVGRAPSAAPARHTVYTPRAATSRRRWSTRPAATSTTAGPTSCSSPAPRRGAPGRRHRSRRRPPDWTTEPEGAAPDEELRRGGDAQPPADEMGRGILMPVQIYPLFENACGAADGRTIAEHRTASPALWAGFSEVAAATPTPGSSGRTRPTRSDARRRDNRMIGFPYTKLMNSNNAVEQSAGADPVLGREGPGARRAHRPLGVPARGHRRPRPLRSSSNRARPALLARHPHRRRAGPSSSPASAPTTSPTSTSTPASRRPCRSPPPSSASTTDRPLTVTGGLSFAGGPWNNYVMHSIATMADRLRDDPDGSGSARPTAATSPSTPSASTAPGRPRPFHGDEPAGRGRRLPGTRELCESFDGPVTVEGTPSCTTATASPSIGLVAVLLDDGRRAWG